MSTPAGRPAKVTRTQYAGGNPPKGCQQIYLQTKTSEIATDREGKGPQKQSRTCKEEEGKKKDRSEVECHARRLEQDTNAGGKATKPKRKHIKDIGDLTLKVTSDSGGSFPKENTQMPVKNGS